MGRRKCIMGRIMAGFIAVFLMLASSVAVYAEDNNVTSGSRTGGSAGSSGSVGTVKVGYYENEVFQEGAAPGVVKTGYAYEYYRKLSEYTGWQYEYVYGSYAALYDKFLSGEIDLLAGLAKREDRLDIIGYPSAPMGTEIYTLVKHDDDASITLSPASITGKKIGVLKSAIVDILNKYLNSNSISAEVVQFDDYESLFSAFDKKDVDILAAEGDGAYGRSHAEIICTFGTSDYYLCVSKSRPDILAELEEAQTLLSTEEPNYIGSLRTKYYSASVSSINFSAAEREWLAANKSLKIGYLNNYLPYSATGSDGKVTGILKDIVPMMFSELSIPGIQVSYTAYDRYDDMVADVREEKIDACFPVGGGLFYSEENSIYQSSPVVSASTKLVFKADSYHEDYKKFAVNENNRMQYYFIRTNYPDAEVIFYPNIDACLKAVAKDRDLATTLNGLRAGEILKNSSYKGLDSKQLGKTDDRSFGVKIGNEGLLKLLNRGIKVLGSEYAREIAFRYSDQLYTYTFMDMLGDNMWLFMSILLLIALLVIIFIVRDLRITRQANRMKTDFVSNMSHEIRTPITAILGMNEMIQMESVNEVVLGYSDNIRRAGESLLGIINDILDFSKIESGHMELVTGPYSLCDLIVELQMLVISRMEEKGLEFSLCIDEELPSMPVGDKQKLRQVVTNLLTNAAKYTEKGFVKMSMKLVSMGEDSFTMEISVEDSGIGIRQEDMGKLYSAFDRLDMERTGTIEGSGLGLAITQRLLGLMNSQIHVESRYGKGSCFSFRVKQGISDASPIGTSYETGCREGDKARRRRSASFTAPEAHILIVDDTPMNLQVICGLLKHNDMMIDTAESGEECLAVFGESDYDMVFLDQRMPGMDGVATLRELKERYPEKAGKTPIICITANVLSGGRQTMLDTGFDDYLSKPVTLLDMEQMLLKYLPAEKIEKNEEDPSEGGQEETTGYEGIPQAILSLDEINVEAGLDYCGDAEDFLSALEVFAASVNKKASSVRDLMDKGDNENLSMLFHSIKSTSRAIGAEGLSGLAKSLEDGTKEKTIEDLEGEIAAFLETYEKLGEKLDSLL